MSNQREMVLESQLSILTNAIVALSRTINELDEADRFPDLDTKEAIAKLEDVRQDLEDQVMGIEEELNEIEDSFNDSMDGDDASALASAGFGTDEDYGYYGDS